MQKRRSKYLYQLIVTSCVLIIVPTVFFFTFIWTKAFNEMERLNDDYHSEMTRLFCGTFVDEVSQLKDCAIVFSQSSKDSDGGLDIFHAGTQKMKENPYYYWEACQRLLEYSQKSAVDYLAVYYYGKDLVLDQKQKYTVERFLSQELGIETSNKIQFERLTELFENSTYEKTEIIYEPIYDKNGSFKELLMGVCIELGKNKEKGLLMFRLDKQDFEFFYLSTLGKTWEKYYVLDSETREVLFVIGDEGLTNTVGLENMISNETNVPNLFFAQNERRGLTFVLDVSDDMSQNNFVKFYRDMRILIVYIVLIMVFIGCMAVWYNYKPIYTLLALTKGQGRNEIDSIYFELNEQNILLSEQRMMIMDLILNRLIYGIPISEAHIDKLGVSEKIKSYCVFLIEKYVLKSSEVDQVMNAVEQKFSTLLFVTDLQGEKSTVIIAFLENAKVEEIHEWLDAWCIANISDEYLLLKGDAVNNINDIQKSLKCCKENDPQLIESNECLKQDVLNYLNEHFKDEDLSQTKVADFCQISIYTLSRLFKNQIKIGFTEYVNGKRFEHAKELLLTTDLAIKEIASRVGINDANYFTRAFKQYFGDSPSTFRKKNKAK